MLDIFTHSILETYLPVHLFLKLEQKYKKVFIYAAIITNNCKQINNIYHQMLLLRLIP